MKKLKNGTWKYRNVTVAPTPLAAYPDMVTIIKGPKKLSMLIGRKFINLEKTKIAIETERAEVYIESGVKSIGKELETMGNGKSKY